MEAVTIAVLVLAAMVGILAVVAVMGLHRFRIHSHVHFCNHFHREVDVLDEVGRGESARAEVAVHNLGRWIKEGVYPAAAMAALKHHVERFAGVKPAPMHLILARRYTEQT